MIETVKDISQVKRSSGTDCLKIKNSLTNSTTYCAPKEPRRLHVLSKKQTNKFLNSLGGGRLAYIDIAKGIGIILVVWAHASGTFTNYIVQFHMPFFFLISGYLYNGDRDLKVYTWRKIKSLYIPFVFWNLLAGLLRFLLVKKSGFPLVYSIQVLLTLTKDGQFFGATWFLGALFVVSLSYRYLDEAFRDVQNKHLILLLGFVMIGFAAKEITLPFSLSRTLILSMFFAIGVCIKECYQLRRVKHKVWLFIAVLGLFIVFGHYSTASMGTNEYPYFITFILTSLTGSYIVISVSKFIDVHMRRTKRFLSLLGRNSIHIVIWHLILFRVVIVVQVLLDGGKLSDLLKYYPVYTSLGLWPLAYSIVGVFGSIAVGKVIEKLCELLKILITNISENKSKI